MTRLFDKNKINLLRDLRQLQQLQWLLPEEYLFFIQWYPKFESNVRKNSDLLKEYNLTPDEFLASLSKPRSPANRNPNNRLGKPRHKWTREQVKRLRSLR